MAIASDPILALAEPGPLRDPSVAYAWLRSYQPLFWHDDLKTLLVSRYQDATTVLRDSARFASDFRRVGENLPPAAISVQTLDPPEHTAIRHLLVDGLRQLDYGWLALTITEEARSRLAGLAEQPSFDFVAEFAEPLALSTVMRVLGVPEPDLAWFKPVADAIVDGMDAGVWPEVGEPAMAARAEISALADGWLMDPTAGGVVAFAAAQATKRGVDPAVLDNTFRVLAHAGYTSASKILSLGAVTLLNQPGALKRLAVGDPALAVEELVRYESPVRAITRVCVVDTSIGGCQLRAGDDVTVLIGAANRDPARFADPDVLTLGRSPNPHLGFGRGVHACLGSSLAALQARVVFSILAKYYPGAVLTAAPIFRRNLTLRGLATAQVALRPSEVRS
jgi:cytochrome P450